MPFPHLSAEDRHTPGQKEMGYFVLMLVPSRLGNSLSLIERHCE